MNPAEKRFNELKDAWWNETSFMSSITDIYANKNHQELIKMGWMIVPLILRDMEKTNNHWFEALHQITGAWPIKQEHGGRIQLMCRDWLEWARQEKIEW